MSRLDARVRCATPSIAVDLAVDEGTTTAVLGPNGAGKSTVLSIIAGLRRNAGSVVTVDGAILQDERTFVAPHRRPVVLLAQKARLFPHLTVRQNVAFAPAAARLPRRRAAEIADHWLDAVGVTELADRRPAQLSGGQVQRVAIARALAADPDVLLLDEPFGALDVDVAHRVRSLLRSLLAERSGATILVTHDLVDAVTLADSVAVMDDGRIVDSGPLRSVMSRPGTSFVASLSGMNLVLGRYAGMSTLVTESGQRIVGDTDDDLIVGGGAAAAFSPRAVAVYLDAPHGSPRTTMQGTVTDLVPSGHHAVVRADCTGQIVDAEVTWAAVADLGLTVGAPVSLVVKAGEVRIYRSGVEPSEPQAPWEASSVE